MVSISTKWTLCGLLAVALAPNSFLASAEADEPLRTWTNRKGDRQAKARLVSVKGAELRLVSAAGRPAKTMLESLSEVDQEYVEAYLKGAATEESKPAFPIVRGMLDKLPGVPGALSHLTTPAGARAATGDSGEQGLVDPENPGIFAPLLRPLPDALPAELIHVRLSRKFLEDFVERDVNRKQPIQDQILGTRISGHAHTSGTTQLVLHPHDSQAVAEVVLRGTIRSQTIGYNGPVRLHSTSHTPFESHKFVFLGPNGIQSSESRSTARTHSNTHHIDSTLPGLRGRIAERIGWRRSGELKGQADAIASRHTEQRLNEQFDKSVDRSVAMARQVFRGKIEKLPTTGELPPQMCYRSTPEYLEMVLRSQDAAAVATVPEPNFDGDFDIAIRVHRAVVRNALTDPTVRKAIQPLLAGLMPLQIAGQVRAPEVLTATPAKADAPEFHVSWSDDQDWIEIDFSGRDSKKLTPELMAPSNNTVVEK